MPIEITLHEHETIACLYSSGWKFRKVLILCQIWQHKIHTAKIVLRTHIVNFKLDTQSNLLVVV